MIKKKAYAKINLSLDVTGKRPNGYHDVRMIMQSIGLYDELTFEINEDYINACRNTGDQEEKASPCNDESPKSNQIAIKFLDLPENIDLGPVEKNLIYRSARLILDTYNIVDTGVIITLKKNIPVAAGMAGGSTDAAAVFHGLNELLTLGMTLDDMCSLGVKIGADVPFCIIGGTQLSEGIGEILTPLPKPPQVILLIAKPNINVSTKMVYEELDSKPIASHPDVDGMIDAISNLDLAKISQLLGNVLETVTVDMYPIINDIKNVMLNHGALNSLMSGSGPTVFGLFDLRDMENAENALNAIKEAKLSHEVYITKFV